MVDAKTYPTDEAWSFLTAHLDDIRSCCANYLPELHGKSMMGEFKMKTRHTIADFDKAVANRDGVALTDIMNDAWLKAPESRSVYEDSGFCRMCDLLDGTVEGLVDPDQIFDDDDEEPAF